MKSYTGQWKKGDKIKRGTGQTVTVISHGDYRLGVNSGLWYYDVKDKYGNIQYSTVPMIDDNVIGRK